MSAAFHTLLGFYNPIQWIVQAQGAAVTAGVLGPTRTLKMLRRQNAIFATQYNKNLSDGYLKRVGQATGYSTEELRATKQLWDKSGFHDSMFSNADVQSAVEGFPVTSGAIRRVFDEGLLFYRAGEGFNRRMAFLAALDEAGDVTKVLNNDDLFRQVITRASDLMLNLGKANRSGFQKGLLSIPTQFKQVIFKTGEAIIGKQFTSAERTRIIASQLMLYGAAGLPFGNWGMRHAMDMAGFSKSDLGLAPGTETEESLNVVKAINGGMMDALALMMFDADVEFSDRLSLVQGFNEMVQAFTEERSVPMELVIGPIASSTSGFWQKFKTIEAVTAGGAEEFQRNHTFDSSLDALQFIGTKLGDAGLSTFSSWRNSTKARVLFNANRLLDRKGKVVNRRDFNWFEKASSALGFQLGDQERLRDLRTVNTDRANHITDVSDTMADLWRAYWVNTLDGPVSEAENRQNRGAIDFLLNEGSGEDYNLRSDILKAYREKQVSFTALESELDKQVDKARQTFNDDLAGDLLSIKARLTPLQSNITNLDERRSQ